VLDEVDPEALGGAWVATWTSQRTSCLLELGRPDEAIEAWTGVLERWTDNDDVASQARLALGDLALGQDRPDDAADWYNEVLNGSPDRHYQARALLGLVHLGQDDACARLMDDFADQHELTRVAAVHCEDSR
jgi:tetratricopeptide (TPR) repeat protein